MQHVIRRSLYVAMLLVMPVLLPSGSFAHDDDFSDLNLLLEGEYRTSLFQSCVQTAGEFDELFIVPAGGAFRTRTTGAITTYNGDQTGDFSALVLNMFAPTLPGPFVAVSQSSTNCEVTYTVNPDRSFTQTLTNCSGIVLTGPQTDVPFTLSDIELQGQIAQGGQILSYTNNDTTVITLTINPDTAEEVIRKRICGGIGTGVKLAPFGDAIKLAPFGDDDDDDKDKHRRRHRRRHKDKHRGKDKHRHRGDD